ncbi:6-phosphogluconolactonase [Pedobacter lusitanus]|uniref:6-phosphogluconolactonase n=1 Tax=Pedobacter lusitanus TaxID=1503925 RepID=A0A0D0FU70_9SPHI|nr:lactonase family protein [Pedobacter lusitanus]KIO75999.1 6-phosphogluconolactonase [Pedobacter lusitanus]
MKNLICLLTATVCFLSAKAQQEDYHLVIGTYTAPGKSEGIYVYDFNTSDAALRLNNVEKNVINPSFLTITPDRKFVYAVNEDGDKSMVSAFSFDAVTGKLGFLNKQKAEGADPCYLIADDKNVLTANYSGGNIGVFGREANGALTPAKQVVQHTGSSINKARQSSAHVHMVRFSPDHRYIISNDLGKDMVYTYAYHQDSPNEVLVLKDSISVKPGSGPRHIIFSSNGKFAYLIQEMTAEVTVFSYNDGIFKKIQEISMLAKDFKGESGAADIQLSADGKFLYVSNRGTANTITTFAVESNGHLINKGLTSTLGKGPRAFVIDPSGNWLLVGHQYTNDVVIFKRNKATGALKDSGKRISVGAPVCFAFVLKDK